MFQRDSKKRIFLILFFFLAGVLCTLVGFFKTADPLGLLLMLLGLLFLLLSLYFYNLPYQEEKKSIKKEEKRNERE